MNQNKILFLSLLFAITLYSSQDNRYPLEVEYKLVLACIDCNSNYIYTDTLRDSCIRKVKNIQKKLSLKDVMNLDENCELVDKFLD